MAGPLTVILLAARAMSRQRGLAQHPSSWVLIWPSNPFLGAGGSSVGDSAAWLVPTLAGRVMSRQRGSAQHPPSWVLVLLVWGTHLHG
jgi:hypothetical protein